MKYSDLENKFDELKKYLKKAIGLSQKNEQDNIDRQNQFAQLDPDTKYKLISPHLNFYTDAISKRAEIVPILSTLAATLIVVTTLNTNLVPLKPEEVKILLSLFLFLIPSTLHFYIDQKEKAAAAALKIVASYQGDDIFDLFKEATFVDHLTSTFPRIVIYLFYAAIFVVLFRIWFG